METSSQAAPWSKDPSAMGRVRLDEETAREVAEAIDQRIEVLHAERSMEPPGSQEAYEILLRIRLLEKFERNLLGTGEEKGWSL